MKYNDLPIFEGNSFCFHRCVDIGDIDSNDWLYNNSIWKLFRNNLRDSSNGRYSKLFPNEKISYWAGSKKLAIKEIKKHGSSKNYIYFLAYDDNSSYHSIIKNNKNLVIINGIELGFKSILDKIENGYTLTSKEQNIVDRIHSYNPDCLIYESVISKSEREASYAKMKMNSYIKSKLEEFVHINECNFLFFENGFNKLLLRETGIYLGERSGNTQHLDLACGSDYYPLIENYSYYFDHIAKIKKNEEFIYTNEFKDMKELIIDSELEKLYLRYKGVRCDRYQ